MVISESQLSVYFVYTFYDIPITGITKIDNNFYLFEFSEYLSNDEKYYYKCHKLSLFDSYKVRLDKWLYDFCVGDNYNKDTIWIKMYYKYFSKLLTIEQHYE